MVVAVVVLVAGPAKAPLQTSELVKVHPWAGQPSCESEERERKRMMDDQQLLTDAGISDTDWNTDEEKQQILKALRESLPPGPSTSSEESDPAGAALGDTEPLEGHQSGGDPRGQPLVDEHLASADVAMSDEQTLAADVIHAGFFKAETGHTRSESPAFASEIEQVQSKTAEGQGRVLRRRVQRRNKADGNGENWERDPDAVSDSESKIKTQSQSDVCKTEPSSGCDYPGWKATVRSGARGRGAVCDGDQNSQPLQTRTMKKFTDEQKHKMGENLRTLIEKTKLQHLPLKEKKEEESPTSSQDLFGEVEEERINEERQSAPSPAEGGVQIRETGDATTELEDMETLPPDSPAHSVCSHEAGKMEDDDGELSQEIPLQTPQPLPEPVVTADSSLEVEAVPAPASQNTSNEEECEKEEDRSPLSGDVCFCWTRSQSQQPLQRIYRKRKRPAETDRACFYSPSNVEPATYTTVILQLFDIYFTHVAKAQSLMKHKIAWGKPVRPGLHCPGTLDKGLRRERPYKACKAEYNDDDFMSAPAAKKPAVGEGVQKQVEQFSAETQPFGVDDELPDLVSLHPRKTAVNPSPAKSETDVGKDIGKRKSPSPVFSSQSSNSRLDENGDLYCTQIPSRKKRKGHDALSSADFVVTEEDIFVDQPLSQQQQETPESSQHRQAEAGVMLSRKTGRQVQSSLHTATEDSSMPFQPLGRKRKQETNSDTVNLIDLSDDEDIFPQKKKRGMACTTGGKTKPDKPKTVLVHIQGPTEKKSAASSQSHQVSAAGAGVKRATVHPMVAVTAGRPGQGLGRDTESQYFTGYVRQGTGHQAARGESSQCHVDLAGDDNTEDSVQFLSLSEPALGRDNKEAKSSEPASHKGGQTAEPRVDCPLCGRAFPSSRIALHASDCQGAEEAEEVPSKVFPRGQTSRRPLHNEPRAEFKCPHCGLQQGGAKALDRHTATCKQKQQQLEKNILTGSRAGSSLGRYTIPKKGDLSKRETIPANSDSDEEIKDVPSDDSEGDPDFALHRDDYQQLKEDMRADGDSPGNFKRISELKGSAIDFRNQFSSKRKTKHTKLAEHK